MYVKKLLHCQEIRYPSIGEMSPVLETNLSPILGSFSLSGDSMKKWSYFMHFQTVLRILLRKSAC